MDRRCSSRCARAGEGRVFCFWPPFPWVFHVFCGGDQRNNSPTLFTNNHFSQVITARGAAAALGLPNAAADAASVSDAVTCVLAAATANERGAAAVAASGGVVALAASLAPPTPPWAPLAVRGLAALLAASPEPGRELEAAAGPLAAALPTLASLTDVSPSDAAAASATAGKRTSGQATVTGSDALAAQLDAIAVCAAVVGAPHSACPSLAAAVAASAAADPGGWPLVIRTGLASLLRARAGTGVRHTALRAAAATADVAGGGGWLLSGDRASASAFLTVVTKVCRVEAALLFRDAAAGDVVVAVEGESGRRPPPTRTDEAGPSTSAAAADDDQDDSDDDNTPSSPSLPPHPPGNAAAAADAAAARWAAAHPPPPPPAPGTETARARAERTLPAVLALTEAALGALALDEEAAAAAEPDATPSTALDDGADLDLAPAPDALPTTYDDSVAVRAFQALQDAVEQALEFLEGEAETDTPSSSSDPLAAPLATAAARCVGRLLADAPAAFGARPRALLPRLLSAGGGAAAPFFVPVLSAAVDAASRAEDDISIDVDDVDWDAWLAAGRHPASLAGLGAATAAAAAAAARSGGGDDAVGALCRVLAGLLEPLSRMDGPAAPTGVAAALAGWAVARVQRGARSAAHAHPPLLDTTLTVARVLALALATADKGSVLVDDAEAVSIALLACLQRGWAAAVVHAQRAAAAAARGRATVEAARDTGGDTPFVPPAAATGADDGPQLSPGEAADALVAWSAALAAAAVALDVSPDLRAAAAREPWVAELAAAPSAAVPESDAAGAAGAVRLFVGVVRRVVVSAGGDEREG